MKEKIDLDLLKKVVQELKRGNEQARGQFYDLTHKAIYRFSFFLSRDESSAHDLCHDTFVKAFGHIESLENEQGALGWLFQIARNTHLDKVKKKKEELVAEYSKIDLGHSLHYEDWLTIKKVLGTFEIDDQMMLIMIDLEGFSYKEAGLALRLSEDAIRMKLRRIRQEFIKKYESLETNPKVGSSSR